MPDHGGMHLGLALLHRGRARFRGGTDPVGLGVDRCADALEGQRDGVRILPPGAGLLDLGLYRALGHLFGVRAALFRDVVEQVMLELVGGEVGPGLELLALLVVVQSGADGLRGLRDQVAVFLEERRAGGDLRPLFVDEPDFLVCRQFQPLLAQLVERVLGPGGVGLLLLDLGDLPEAVSRRLERRAGMGDGLPFQSFCSADGAV